MKNFKAMVQTNSKNLLMAATGAVTVVATSVTAFASGAELPTIAITSDMLTPLVDGVVANIGVVLPVGIGLFATFLGIRLIPALISRFTKV